ncbi:hypothetical protein TNCV_1112551 [Trichonephila clavipes]|uniref:Uncharacterized protein n=1 Tax=Trichonephila clavipes TaxID=2585209 RepID=A0A8X6V2L4_TRICX|nr:hypothetical protein TNCV_1112551 [Trichonephila clavipes]
MRTCHIPPDACMIAFEQVERHQVCNTDASKWYESDCCQLWREKTLLRPFRFEVFENPPFNPDHSPCEYFFGLLKKTMRKRNFLKINEVQATFENWFHDQAGHSSPRISIMSLTPGTLLPTYKTTLSSLYVRSVLFLSFSY